MHREKEHMIMRAGSRQTGEDSVPFDLYLVDGERFRGMGSPVHASHRPGQVRPAEHCAAGQVELAVMVRAGDDGPGQRAPGQVAVEMRAAVVRAIKIAGGPGQQELVAS